VYTRDSIDRVRDAVDMVALVGARTDLRRVGSRWVGLCPFHDERTPSFSVNAEDGLYYCFGCGAKGDAIGFVRETEALDFPGAVELLAERTGVALEREKGDPREEERRRRRERLLALLERGARFYAAYLWESAEARRAREYLAGRGLSEETLRAFGVGYSPKAWDRVLVRAQEQGYRPDELLAVDLAARRRDGAGIYDRFRGRIMFPLADSRGRVRGFGARKVGDEAAGPKYLNTAEGELYHKGEQLFGLHLAKPEASRLRSVIAVEGYTDVLALHQARIRHAVAVMGTALTQGQIEQLTNTVGKKDATGAKGRILLALDADRSGQEAMLRAAEAVAKRGTELRVVELPAGTDPADLVSAEGREAFAARLEDASTVLEFQVRRVLADADLDTPAGRDRALEEVRPLIAASSEWSAVREDLIRVLSDRLELSVHQVTTALDSRPRRAAPGGGPATASAAGPSFAAERAFLVHCAAAGEVGRRFLGRLEDGHLSFGIVRRARDHLRARFDDPLVGLPEDEPALARFVSEVVLEAGATQTPTETSLQASFLDLEGRRIDRELRRAVRDSDLSRQDQLAAERQRVRSEMDSVMGQTT
jgi:DNA primase